jgi:hypothetical protein
MRHNSSHLLIVVLASLLFAGCLTNPDESKKLDELHRIASEIPVHPSFKQIDSNYMMKSTVVDYGLFYQSAADYDDVKNFYVKELNARGWNSLHEVALDGENKELTFGKGEYGIAIEYDSAARQQWNYATTYFWKRP